MASTLLLSLFAFLAAWVTPADAADVILRVRANAPAAEVYLDGTLLGPVPVTAYITPGTHQLRVVADNFDPFVRRFEVTEGKAVDVTATLTPGNGTAEWTGPAGARLWVDDRERGVLPLRLPALTPGSHTWRVEAPRFEPATGTLDVVFGKNYLVAVEMRSSEGVFVVETTPPGAEVRLDGAVVGTTPWRAEDIQPGVHGVELRLAGYATVLRAVDTTDGSRGEVVTSMPKSGATLSVATRSASATVFVNEVAVGTGATVTAGPLEKGRATVRVVDGEKMTATAVTLPGSGRVELRVVGTSIEKRPPLTQRWGFWTAVAGGAVVVAGGTTAAVIAAQPPPLPSGDTVEVLP